MLPVCTTFLSGGLDAYTTGISFRVDQEMPVRSGLLSNRVGTPYEAPKLAFSSPGGTHGQNYRNRFGNHLLVRRGRAPRRGKGGGHPFESLGVGVWDVAGAIG